MQDKENKAGIRPEEILKGITEEGQKAALRFYEYASMNPEKYCSKNSSKFT